MKNKFINLANKLIGNRLWRSKIEVIQLEQSKDANGRAIFIETKRKTCWCVAKEIKKTIDDAIPNLFTEFIISSKSLRDFKIDKKLINLVYNGRKFLLEDVIIKGQLSNEHCVVSFIVRR